MTVPNKKLYHLQVSATLMFIHSFGNFIREMTLAVNGVNNIENVVSLHVSFCLAFITFSLMKDYAYPQLALLFPANYAYPNVESIESDVNKTTEKKNDENPPTYSEIFIGEE